MYKLIVDTSNTYYLDSINKDIDNLVNMHDNILSKKIIGKTVEGREIISIEFDTNKKIKKQGILFVGGIHAREDFSVMLVMKMLDYIAYYYNTNQKWEGIDLKKLLNNIKLYFLPVANPDGLNIVHNGIKSSINYKKLKHIPLVFDKEEYWKANANGVDINKNFDDGNWYIRKSKPEMSMPCSEGFKGFEPNSELETKALIKYCENNEFLGIISYHCTGNVVFWADSGTHEIFNGIDEEIIDKFSSQFIYRKTKISQDPSWYGCGFENWYRSHYQRPGFVLELSPFSSPKQHPDSMFDELVWQYAKFTGIYFVKEAIKLQEKMYDIKQEGKLIKTFYEKKQAIKFAEEIKNSYVVNQGKIIWSYIEKYAAVDKN